ncbi:aminotransferase class IV [Nocardioides sp. SYSU DS0651]|uniref:aminotransferase class IV n=1 Tax=Nocardioides sp. SYSU DS0651 TaxID=3415955 RepID=UPI003F4C2440
MNVAYLNGERCLDLTQISLYNPSFLYGISCFEGIRAYWNDSQGEMVFFDLEAHLDRLYKSADDMRLEIPIDRAVLAEQIGRILVEHRVAEDVYIRVTVYLGGDGSWRTTGKAHYAVSVRSAPGALGSRSPVALGISRYRRITADSMPPQVKAGANYLNSRYAYLDAVDRGFDNALFLTHDGVVSESTGAAVFFVTADALETPPLDSDVLPSVTRRRVIQLCRAAEMHVVEKRIDPARLGDFDAAFLVGTSVEVTPISAIEQHVYQPDHESIARVSELLATWVAAGAR